jgi:hypothetical protein
MFPFPFGLLFLLRYQGCVLKVYDIVPYEYESIILTKVSDQIRNEFINRIINNIDFTYLYPHE